MILGLDIGDKRVGVAIADFESRVARPLTTLANNRRLIGELSRLQKVHGFTCIVIGLPMTLAGHVGDQARKTMELAERIKLKLLVNIVFEDERMTSKDATVRLSGITHNRSDVDALSASIILGSWLDRQRKS